MIPSLSPGQVPLRAWLAGRKILQQSCGDLDFCYAIDI
jgi:hypothetical protein